MAQLAESFQPFSPFIRLPADNILNLAANMLDCLCVDCSVTNWAGAHAVTKLRRGNAHCKRREASRRRCRWRRRRRPCLDDYNNNDVGGNGDDNSDDDDGDHDDGEDGGGDGDGDDNSRGSAPAGKKRLRPRHRMHQPEPASHDYCRLLAALGFRYQVVTNDHFTYTNLVNNLATTPFYFTQLFNFPQFCQAASSRFIQNNALLQTHAYLK